MITNSVYPIASIITSEMSRKKVRVSIVWGQVYGDPTIRLLSWKQIDFEVIDISPGTGVGYLPLLIGHLVHAEGSRVHIVILITIDSQLPE